jgi:hypothetical protein
MHSALDRAVGSRGRRSPFRISHIPAHRLVSVALSHGDLFHAFMNFAMLDLSYSPRVQTGMAGVLSHHNIITAAAEWVTGYLDTYRTTKPKATNLCKRRCSLSLLLTSNNQTNMPLADNVPSNISTTPHVSPIASPPPSNASLQTPPPPSPPPQDSTRSKSAVRPGPPPTSSLSRP